MDWHSFCHLLLNEIVFVMKVPKKTPLLSQFEIEKLCHLLQCDKDELFDFEKLAYEISEESDSTYDAVMKLLQKGHNVREATLIALFIGRTKGYLQAESDMEEEIKDKLYKAFRGNREE